MARSAGWLLVLAACARQPPSNPSPIPPAPTTPPALPSPAPVTPTPSPGIELRSVAWSPDGKTIAIGASDETIVIDAETHRELGRLTESRGWNYVSFLPDGRLVTQGNSDAVP